MFWNPAGGTPADGCYVRYPAEELWAVACLEAQRAGAVLIGENLGTVPPEVEAALAEHDVAGMHVLQFGLDAASLRRPIPERCLAALGTHDTPTFAGFWQGLDIDDRLDLGLCDAEGAARERARRAGERADLLAHLTAFGLAPTDEADPVAIAGASLEHLARGDARLVLVNLEDLCGETRPHNVPGTDDARRPNWRRKARFTTDELIARPDVAARLAAIDRARRARQGR
jgi:4-alpha-glucanotransferase